MKQEWQHRYEKNLAKIFSFPNFSNSFKEGAIHLTKVHKLTALAMKENPNQWKFKTVKVPAV